MSKSEDEFIVYPAGQVVVDTVGDTAKQLTGQSNQGSIDASVREIEKRTGNQVHQGHRALFRARQIVSSQVAPAVSAVMEDVARHGSTRENTQAIAPAVAADAALAIPRLHALTKDPIAFEVMTLAETGVVQAGRHAYDKLVLGNKEVRRYSVPTEGMKRIGKRLQGIQEQAVSKINELRSKRATP